MIQLLGSRPLDGTAVRVEATRWYMLSGSRPLDGTAVGVEATRWYNCQDRGY